MGVSPTKWSTVYMYTEVWLVSRLQKCTSWVCTRHPALWEILVVLCNGLRLEARGYLAIDNRHTCTLCCLVLWKNFVSSLSLHAVLFAWLRMWRNANSWSKHPLVRIQPACLRVHTWSGGSCFTQWTSVLRCLTESTHQCLRTAPLSPRTQPLPLACNCQAKRNFSLAR